MEVEDRRSKPHRRSAVEHAQDHLTRLIDLKEFKPGDRLPSAASLAADVGVSRPILLVALKNLEAQGRVTVGPGMAGARVLGPSGPHEGARLAWMTENRKIIAEMAILRDIIEPGVAGLLADQGMPRLLSVKARNLISKMWTTDEALRQDHLALDTEFHRLLGKATGVSVLEEMIETCRIWVAPVFDLLSWPKGRRSVSNEEHQRILDAIEARDATAASKAARDHVRASRTLIDTKMRALAKIQKKNSQGSGLREPRNLRG